MTFEQKVKQELERARGIHSEKFASIPDGCGIILEEIDELWDEVRKKEDQRNFAAIHNEAVQVGAMCVRAKEDLGFEYDFEEQVRNCSELASKVIPTLHACTFSMKIAFFVEDIDVLAKLGSIYVCAHKVVEICEARHDAK